MRAASSRSRYTTPSSVWGCPRFIGPVIRSPALSLLPARNAALDVAKTATLQSLDGERFAPDVIERIAQQVIRLEPHQQWIKQPLHPAYGCHGAANMLEPHQAPIRSEHASDFVDCQPIVRHRAQRECHNHRVERLGRETKRLRVTELQVHVIVQLQGSGPGKIEHCWAEVDSDQMYARGIRVQVPAGPDTDLQHIALRLGTYPPSAVLKEQSLPRTDHSVVAASHLLVNRAHSLGLAGVSHARCLYSSLSGSTARTEATESA